MKMIKLPRIPTLRFFNNLKTTWKLIIIVGVVVVASIWAGGFSYFSIQSWGKQTKSLYYNNVQGVTDTALFRSSIVVINTATVNLVTRSDKSRLSDIQPNIDRIDTYMASILSRAKNIDPTVVESAEYVNDAWNEIKSLLMDLLKSPDDFIGSAKGNAINSKFYSLNLDLDLLTSDMIKLGNRALDAANNNAKKQSASVLLYQFVTIVLAVILVIITVRSISHPLHSLRMAMVGLAQGNLVLPKLPPIYRDEIGETNQAYQQSVRQLREMINVVTQVTDSLAEIAKDLAPQIEAAGNGAETVRVTMNELVKGTQEEARAADDVSTTIYGVANQINQVDEKTQVIAVRSKKVIDQAKQGETNSQTILKRIDELNISTGQATTVIRELHGQSLYIEEIIGKIREITEQTQLLSLNASIEAARAGEQGRGFAVVAQEIGKLSEKSAHSVEDVTRVLDNIRSMIGEAVRVMEEGSNKVREGQSDIAETSQYFQEIFTSINEVAVEIQSVAADISQLTQANNRVLSEVDTIAAITEETAAHTEEVLATVDTQAASFQALTSGMNKLNDFSEQLQSLVSRFHV